MSKIFNSVQVKSPTRNHFNLSHDFKFTGNMGYIIPTLALECIPGDKFKIGCKAMTRFMPMTSPVMQHFQMKMEYYFVANRLLWDQWEDFITPGKANPLPGFPVWSVDPAVPANYTRLLNYLGVPDPATIPTADSAELISALPMAAYQFIYNEYYRNNQIDPEVDYKLISGANNANADLSVLRKRGWLKDYYTSALPSAQAGAAVDIPLGDVELKIPGSGSGYWKDSANHSLPIPDGDLKTLGGAGETVLDDGISPVPTVYDPAGSLEVAPVTINTLRRAFRLQEWLERAMRGGTRYVESIWSFFKVKSPDSRLQRPEYITGVKTNVQISEVLNTTGTDDLPQGNMAGHGIAVLSDDKYGTYFCQEHGYIIGVMSIVPKPLYFQGIPKHFLKYQDPYQYFWEQFANIGEQAIEGKEIYAYENNSAEDVFGYTPRYAEYKQIPNRIAGQLQTTLKSWTLARTFDAAPTLTEPFIHIDPATTDQIFAVVDPEEDKLVIQIYHDIGASRQMPIYGTPTI